ncbi:MAG: deoxyribodipyrimidine photo-lyase, partial [Gammaproteobacteria bacterium]
PFYMQPYPVERYLDRLAPQSSPLPGLAELGFHPTNLAALKLPTGMAGGAQLFADFLDRIDRYADTRDFPGVKGPSYLSVHLRFGTVS